MFEEKHKKNRILGSGIFSTTYAWYDQKDNFVNVEKRAHDLSKFDSFVREIIISNCPMHISFTEPIMKFGLRTLQASSVNGVLEMLRKHKNHVNKNVDIVFSLYMKHLFTEDWAEHYLANKISTFEELSINDIQRLLVFLYCMIKATKSMDENGCVHGDLHNKNVMVHVNSVHSSQHKDKDSEQFLDGAAIIDFGLSYVDERVWDFDLGCFVSNNAEINWYLVLSELIPNIFRRIQKQTSSLPLIQIASILLSYKDSLREHFVSFLQVRAMHWKFWMKEWKTKQEMIIQNKYQQEDGLLNKNTSNLENIQRRINFLTEMLNFLQVYHTLKKKFLKIQLYKQLPIERKTHGKKTKRLENTSFGIKTQSKETKYYNQKNNGKEQENREEEDEQKDNNDKDNRNGNGNNGNDDEEEEENRREKMKQMKLDEEDHNYYDRKRKYKKERTTLMTQMEGIKGGLLQSTQWSIDDKRIHIKTPLSNQTDMSIKMKNNHGNHPRHHHHHNNNNNNNNHNNNHNNNNNTNIEKEKEKIKEEQKDVKDAPSFAFLFEQQIEREEKEWRTISIKPKNKPVDLSQLAEALEQISLKISTSPQEALLHPSNPTRQGLDEWEKQNFTRVQQRLRQMATRNMEIDSENKAHQELVWVYKKFIEVEELYGQHFIMSEIELFVSRYGQTIDHIKRQAQVYSLHRRHTINLWTRLFVLFLDPEIRNKLLISSSQTKSIVHESMDDIWNEKSLFRFCEWFATCTYMSFCIITNVRKNSNDYRKFLSGLGFVYFHLLTTVWKERRGGNSTPQISLNNIQMGDENQQKKPYLQSRTTNHQDTNLQSSTKQAESKEMEGRKSSFDSTLFPQSSSPFITSTSPPFLDSITTHLSPLITFSQSGTFSPSPTELYTSTMPHTFSPSPTGPYTMPHTFSPSPTEPYTSTTPHTFSPFSFDTIHSLSPSSSFDITHSSSSSSSSSTSINNTKRKRKASHEPENWNSNHRPNNYAKIREMFQNDERDLVPDPISDSMFPRILTKSISFLEHLQQNEMFAWERWINIGYSAFSKDKNSNIKQEADAMIIAFLSSKNPFETLRKLWILELQSIGNPMNQDYFLQYKRILENH